jgi:hypothetical protein
MKLSLGEAPGVRPSATNFALFQVEKNFTFSRTGKAAKEIFVSSAADFCGRERRERKRAT